MDQEYSNQVHFSSDNFVNQEIEMSEATPNLNLFKKIFTKSNHTHKGHQRTQSDISPFHLPTHLDQSKNLLYKICSEMVGGEKFYKQISMLLFDPKVSDEEKEKTIALSIYFLDKETDKNIKKYISNTKKMEELFEVDWKNRFQQQQEEQVSCGFSIDKEQEKIEIIVDFLLTKNGHLNTPLLSLIKDKLYPHDTNDDLPSLSIFSNPNASEQVKYVLQVMDEDHNLVVHLERISLPGLNAEAARSLIHAALKIPYHHKLTLRNVRQLALQALFSHCRQREQGSCFAVFIPIYLKMNDLHHCLHDLEQLLEEGSLLQLEEQCSTETPLVMPKLSQKEKTMPLYMDSKGNLYDNSSCVHFTEFTPLKGVIRCLDLSLGKKEMGSLVSLLGLKEKKSIVTLANLLSVLVHLAHDQHLEISKKQLLERAQIAFLSYFRDPLVACWEKTIASMSELEVNTNLKDMLYKAVVPLIFHFFDQKLSKELKKNKMAFSFLISILQNCFMQNTRFKYDSLRTASYSSLEGGYVLQRLEKQDVWKKVGGEKGFIILMKQIIDCAMESLGKSKTLEVKHLQELKGLLGYVRDEKLDENFLLQVRKSIESEVLQETESGTLSSSSRPWLLFMGYDSLRMLELYFGNAREVKKRNFKPKNALDALKHIIDISKYFKQLGMKKHSLPMRITGFHAFSFLFKQLNELIELNGLKTTLQIVEEWQMKAQERKVALRPKEVEDLLKKAVIKWKLDPFKSYPLNGDIVGIKKILIEKLSYKQSIHQIIHLEKEIEEWILNKLSSRLKGVIFQDLIFFADTNYSKNREKKFLDVYWGFFYNPFSGQVEFSQTGYYKEKIKLMDAKLFINREWDIFYDC